MSFAYTQAHRDKINICVALAGASGSGKTYSAMLLSTALGRGRPFLMLDTEGKRGLHYDKQFSYEHWPLEPPYRPMLFKQKIEEGVARGFHCIIVDNMSDEWAGPGGMLSWVDDLAVKNEFTRWKEPRKAHDKMMQYFRRIPCNLVFCLRAKEKSKVVPNPTKPGKTMVVPLGWLPICDDLFMGEMTVSFTLDNTKPGEVDLSLPHKCYDQFKTLFPEGSLIGPAAASGLLEFADGGDATHPDEALWRDAREAANLGTVKLRDFAEGLSEDDRARLRPIRRELNDTAKAADANTAGPPPPVEEYLEDRADG